MRHILFAVLFFSLILPQITTHAADFSVATAAELIAAINTANGDAAADTITLTADITLTATDNTANGEGNNALPAITSPITIFGAGHTLQRDPSYGCPDALPERNFRLLYVDGGANGSLTLQDITLSNGCLNNGSRRMGGAVYSDNAPITLVNVTASNNFASSQGGAIGGTGAVILTVHNSTFSNNRTNSSGAAIGAYIVSGNDPQYDIYNSTFTDNLAGNGGGAVYIESDGNSEIYSSTFSNNDGGTNRGGAISKSSSGDMDISNSNFLNNRAEGAGAIQNSGGNMSITNSTFRGNTVTNTFESYGGAIGVSSDSAAANLNVNNSTFENNTVTVTSDKAFGGAIGFQGDDLQLTNNTFTGNESINNNANGEGWGGAIYYSGFGFGPGSIEFSNSTFTDNQASHIGGAIYTEDDLTLSHVTMINNSAPTAGAVYGDNVDLDFDYSLFNNNGAVACNANGGMITPTESIGDAPCGDGTAPTGLGTLTDNGGSTQTVALGAASNAIGFAASSGFTTDQRDVERNPDAGAFEFTTTALGELSFTTTAQTVDETDGTATATLQLTNPDGRTDSIDAFLTISGTAAPEGVDYNTTVTVPLTINYDATGTATSNIDLTLIDDTILEGSENVILQINTLNGPASVGANNTHTVTITDNETPPAAAVSGATNTGSASTGSATDTDPSVAPYDPAISKVGFLLPGQVGITGEQLEWVVTVTNNGTTPAPNVTVTDSLVPALRVDRVEAPGATTSINGQDVTVTYATLNPGQTAQFSIFTTVLNGVEVSNTACVNAPEGQRCATGQVVRQLPQTGEPSRWRSWWR